MGKRFDPERPVLYHATGVPKKQGGWKGWAFAAVVVGAMLAIYFTFN